MQNHEVERFKVSRLAFVEPKCVSSNFPISSFPLHCLLNLTTQEHEVKMTHLCHSGRKILSQAQGIKWRGRRDPCTCNCSLSSSMQRLWHKRNKVCRVRQGSGHLLKELQHIPSALSQSPAKVEVLCHHLSHWESQVTDYTPHWAPWFHQVSLHFPPGLTPVGKDCHFFFFCFQSRAQELAIGSKWECPGWHPQQTGHGSLLFPVLGKDAMGPAANRSRAAKTFKWG